MVLLLVLATLFVFGDVLRHAFVAWDDNLNVYDNPCFRETGLAGAARFWREPYLDLYIPLTYTVWAAQAKLAARPAQGGDGGGFDPRVFHATNLALHALSVLVVFGILRIAIGSPPPGTGSGARPAGRQSAGGTHARHSVLWAAGAGALLFAVHPLQVEAVAWVTGMKDLLAGLLALTAIGLFLRSDRPPVLCLASVAFALALLAKPAAVVAPFVVLIVAARRSALATQAATAGQGPARARLRGPALVLGLWFALAAGWSLLTAVAQPAAETGVRVPLWARPFVAGDALAFYLWKLVWPLRLAPDYGRAPPFVLGHWWGYVTWLIPVAGAALLLCQRRKRPWLLRAAAVSAAAALPTLGLIPFGFQTYSTVSDRYVYLAMLGPALALAHLLCLPVVRAHWKAGTAASLVTLAALGLGSRRQAAVWRDSRSLFAHTLRVNPASWLSHGNMGVLLAEAGRTAEALARYRQALALNPDHHLTHNNLGLLLVQTGHTAEGIAHYRRALAIAPGYAEAYNNLGLALEVAGALDEAIVQFSKALEAAPDFAEPHVNMGVTLERKGQLAEAAAHYSEALLLDPRNVDAHINLGNVLDDLDGPEAAVRHFSAALRLAPDSDTAHYNLGNLFARQGDYDSAVRHFSETLRMNPDLAQARRNLRLALQRRAERASSSAGRRD